MNEMRDNFSRLVFPKLFCSWTPFGFEKITMDPHILVQANSVQMMAIQS
jgi:hypothetical protein